MILERPEEVVRTVFRALNTGDWEAVAALMPTKELDRFRRTELRFIEIQIADRPRSVEEFAADVPGMPREEVERLSSQEVAMFERERRWRRPHDIGCSSIEEMKELTARELFLRWLDASYRSTPDWHAGVSSGKDRRTVNRMVLGSVPEIREARVLAHVVYRHHDDPDFPSGICFTTLQHGTVQGLATEDGWRIRLDYRLLLPRYYPRGTQDDGQ